MESDPWGGRFIKEGSALPTVTLLGCPVAACAPSCALEWMVSAVEQRRPTYVVTLNAQYLWQMARDAAFREYVLSAGLIVPEYAIVWAARRLGTPGLEHIGGITLLREFLDVASRKGFRVYLLGAKTEVVATLAEQLRRRHGPGFVAGWHDGYLSPADEEEVGREVRQLRPDAVFVAMGLPRQDWWIRKHGSALGVPLCMGVGGSFDVLAGLKPDAPLWARGRGLEWLYRIYLDPRAYLRRYMTVNAWFVLQVYRARLRRR